MSSADIDRSHRVGKPDNQGHTAVTSRTRHPDIIVKFATYNGRHRQITCARKSVPPTFIDEVLIKFHS